MISITKRKFAAAIVVVSILGFASASAAGFLGVDVPQSSSSQRMTIVPSVPQNSVHHSSASCYDLCGIADPSRACRSCIFQLTSNSNQGDFR